MDCNRRSNVKHKYVIIDNRARDASLDSLTFKQLDGNSGPFDYIVSLAQLSTGTICNVTSIRVKAVTMARPQTEDYVMLDIEPMLGNIMTLDGETSGASMAIAFENYNQNMTTVCLKVDHLFGAHCKFTPPLGKLDKIHVRFRKFGGDSLSDQDFLNGSNVLLPNWDRHALYLDVAYEA